MSAVGHQPGSPGRPGSKIWLWLVALLLLQIAAWTAWLVIASRHKVAEVPLEAHSPR